MGGSGLDRTGDFQKLCGSGLDRIQFYRIGTGLAQKDFTVRSSLIATWTGFYILLLRPKERGTHCQLQQSPSKRNKKTVVSFSRTCIKLFSGK